MGRPDACVQTNGFTSRPPQKLVTGRLQLRQPGPSPFRHRSRSSSRGSERLDGHPDTFLLAERQAEGRTAGEKLNTGRSGASSVDTREPRTSSLALRPCLMRAGGVATSWSRSHGFGHGGDRDRTTNDGRAASAQVTDPLRRPPPDPAASGGCSPVSGSSGWWSRSPRTLRTPGRRRLRTGHRSSSSRACFS